MSTCSISFPRKEGHMLIICFQNKHVIKERGNKLEKVRIKPGEVASVEVGKATWQGQ